MAQKNSPPHRSCSAWYGNRWPIFMLAITMVISLQTQSKGSAKSALTLAAESFDKGDYKKAIDLLHTLDVKRDLDSSEEMELALKIRAISFAATKRKSEAILAIRELYFLNPDYEFDGFTTPKNVMELASAEKQAIEEKNQIFRLTKTEQAPAIPLAPQIIEREILIENKPPLVNSLFPLGLNHFPHTPVQGSIYLSLQGISLAANILAYWWKDNLFQEINSRQFSDSKSLSQFNTAQTIQFVALGTLVASYAASVIHALVDHAKATTKKTLLNEITKMD